VLWRVPDDNSPAEAGLCAINAAPLDRGAAKLAKGAERSFLLAFLYRDAVAQPQSLQ
jgi:hypothetical protein